MDKQTTTFVASILENLPREMEGNSMQPWIEQPLKLKEFLKGLYNPRNIPVFEYEFVVNIRRGLRPDYPEWVRKVLHRGLDCQGPIEYNLSKDISELLSGKQEAKMVTIGHEVYAYLKENNKLTACLSLQDGVAIKSKGIAVFCKLFFEGKEVFLWKSIVESCDGNSYVPYLHVDGTEVKISWKNLDASFDAYRPALVFNK